VNIGIYEENKPFMTLFRKKAKNLKNSLKTNKKARHF